MISLPQRRILPDLADLSSKLILDQGGHAHNP
jgi:hypothetical protein